MLAGDLQGVRLLDRPVRLGYIHRFPLVEGDGYEFC